MPTGNAATLTSIGSAWKGRADAPQPPQDALEGKKISFTADGNASATSFNIPHGLKNAAGNGIAPTGYILEPRNAISAAAHWVSSVTTANIVVTFTSAPASGTANVTFMVTAFK